MQSKKTNSKQAVLSNQSKVKACVIIQKHWRGYLVRKRYPKLLKRFKKRNFIVMELLQSERTYCQNLQFIVKEVLIPSQTLITDKEKHIALFRNIEQIHNLHSYFLETLEKVMKNYNPHLTKLSEALQKGLFNKEEFKNAYTLYCFNYKTTDQTIKEVTSKNANFNLLLKKVGLSSLHLSLESYMIKPVQRLCKYGLIIDEYIRNMEKDHPDFQQIQQTSSLIDKLVHETNDQVQEFLMRERLQQLKATYSYFFNQIQASNEMRMYFQTKEIQLLSIIQEEEVAFKSLALFKNSCVLLPHKPNEQPLLLNFSFGREIPNSKYYKNLIQLIDAGNYKYIQFKDQKDRKQFYRILQSKIQQQEQQEFKDYIKISILGTEMRESFFSSYTVYIVNIDSDGKVNTIYPRFKDLLKVQDLMLSKGMKFQPLLLSKQSIISTLKSKTIEKRKLAIQEFLERVFNNCQIPQIKQIEDILGISQRTTNAMLQRMSTAQTVEVSVYLPNQQKVKAMVSIDAKIKDLKSMISERMGMESTNQFEIFQIRNKNYSSKKLLYDGEPVKKIIDQQKEALTSINPFRDDLDYLYTRHYYLSKDQEEELYKCDQARAELQLSVIHSDILNYKLEEEVMLTFMCLFALYIHLPIENTEKLNFYIKQVTKKSYKVSEEEFRIYYSQVKRMIAGEDSLDQSLPLIIIKIVSNSYLYQCLQFEVEVHYKVYPEYKKMFPSLDQSIILGLHPQIVYLLSKDRSVTAKFSYSQLSLTETRPKSVVLQVLHTPTPLILKTQISFEISKIFQIYKKKR